MSKERVLWRIFFGSLLLSSLLAILDIRDLALDKGFALTQPKWLVLLIIIALVGILAATPFILTWTKSFEKLEKPYDIFLARGKKMRWVFSALFVITLFVLPFLVLNPYFGTLFGNRLWIKILVFLLLTFVSATFLRVARMSFAVENEEISWTENILFAALAQLLVYQLLMVSLYITDYPFALGWTRDSRYYYASLFFSQKIYGQKLPLPILHPSLHFLLSLPFLFGKLPLWVYRAWTVALTLGLSWAISVVLAKKIRKELLNSRAVFFALWAFLFLVQGSIYAHLLLPALIIFAFVSPKKIKRSWIAIIIASIWVGASRINWFPVPAMLAALIYFLETRGKGKRFLNYFSLPTAWFFAGVVTAFFSQALYIQLSGNSARNEFFTSLASDLLWYRLLPNVTYTLGILWGAVFLSLPLIILVFYAGKKWDFFQKTGIFSILLILFAGGLVVSVKIGGGADLHNMDAYFVSILLVGALIIAREFGLDSLLRQPRGEMLFAATLVLAWFILHGAGSMGYDQVATTAALNDIQAQSTRVAAQGDEVLFISQRHLLAVRLIEGIPLVSEYEKDVLMEMVMSHNGAYMGKFYKDLHDQRFGLIVIDPQKDSLLDEKRSFGAENNIWILKVTRPLWCYYEPLILYERVGVELYVPRAVPLNCD